MIQRKPNRQGTECELPSVTLWDLAGSLQESGSSDRLAVAALVHLFQTKRVQWAAPLPWEPTEASAVDAVSNFYKQQEIPADDPT